MFRTMNTWIWGLVEKQGDEKQPSRLEYSNRTPAHTGTDICRGERAGMVSLFDLTTNAVQESSLFLKWRPTFLIS